jgi:hypothetical protein
MKIRVLNLAKIISVMFITVIVAQENTVYISGILYSMSSGFHVTEGCENLASDFEVKFITEEGQTYIGEVYHSFCTAPDSYSIETDLALNIITHIPNEISINQNYPNPFNPTTQISVIVPNKCRFEIYDILGREVNTLELDKPGEYNITWGGADKNGIASPAGIYLYRLTDETTSKTGKMTLLDGGASSSLSFDYIGNTQNTQILFRERSINGTIELSAPCITDISLPVTITQYATINLMCNIAPRCSDRTYGVYTGDTLNVDLNSIIRNDNRTIFEISENSHFTQLDDDIIQYIPTESETLTVEITGIDSLDTSLSDTMILTTHSSEPPPSVEYNFEIDTMGYGYANYMHTISITENNDYIAGGFLYLPDWYSCNAIIREDDSLSAVRLFFDQTPDILDIHYFNESDIWATGGLPCHFDGDEWTLFRFSELGLGDSLSSIAMWGPNSDNMYFSGLWGCIVHYQDGEWEQIGTGITNLHLQSIHGTPDGSHVFITGYSNTNNPPLDPFGTIVLEIVGDEVNVLYEVTEPNQPGEHGLYVPQVYVLGDTAYFACDQSLWKYNYLTQESINVMEYEGFPGIFPRGGLIVNAPDDIIMVGAMGEINLFNGQWYQNTDIKDRLANTYGGSVDILGMDYKEGKLYLAGSINTCKALIARGYRIE